jgi:hypothetical protein
MSYFMQQLLLGIGTQVLGAAGAYCTRMSSSATTSAGKAAAAVGAQLCRNGVQMCAWGSSAANSESTASGAAEQKFLGYVAGLPAIT